VPGLFCKKANIDEKHLPQWTVGELGFFVSFFTLICGAFIYRGLANLSYQKVDAVSSAALGSTILALVWLGHGRELIKRIVRHK